MGKWASFSFVLMRVLAGFSTLICTASFVFEFVSFEFDLAEAKRVFLEKSHLKSPRSARFKSVRMIEVSSRSPWIQKGIDLLVGVGGIYVCFFTLGLLQEKMYEISFKITEDPNDMLHADTRRSTRTGKDSTLAS